MIPVDELDLWTPLVAEADQHPNFRNALREGSESVRRVISSWSSGFTDRDGKFIDEFQRTFDSSFWELYLFAAFKEIGLNPSLKHAAPDFMLEIGGATVAAEAAVAKEAAGYRPEWDKLGIIYGKDAGPSVAQMLRYTTVRLAQSFSAKLAKYRKQYAQLAHVRGAPFVLCLAAFDQPFGFEVAQQAMRRVLYGADTPIFERDEETGEAVILGSAGMDSVTKDTGAEIPLGVFRNGSCKEVSAVIFSSLATFSKARALTPETEEFTYFVAKRYNAYGTVPLGIGGQKPHYRETLLDGLVLCINPLAEYPVDHRAFERAGLSLETCDPSTGEYLSHTPHEFLISRFCHRIGPVETVKEPRDDGRAYTAIQSPVWPEGELRKAVIVMPPAVEHWMAHYKGWTLVLFRDGVDNTWHGFAVEQIVHSIPEVIEINRKEIIRSVWCLEDHPDRDHVLAHIKQEIEQPGDSQHSH